MNFLIVTVSARYSHGTDESSCKCASANIVRVFPVSSERFKRLYLVLIFAIETERAR